MNLFIRKADLIDGNVLVIANQNKETIFIASRDKDNPLLIQLFNRLNTKIGEIKLKNNFLKIYGIEINGEEVATINAVPVIDMKYVHIGKINWNITGNIIMSNYHITKGNKEIMQVQPTILSLGHPGLELDINEIDHAPVCTLIAIFLDKYVRIPNFKPDKTLNLGFKSKVNFNNFKKLESRCKSTKF
ncbi:LURP-one-related/scramblase family protein [Companilactobacillus keshanensis]|uniref:Uncharacterized protein n=1 Tax=Companilactobacillus keshanensis TaxID=2486003 RepID=A0ABW4BTF7_9LACO|nr:hypothetical protein [Companilactobacillus keshanensis]